MCHTNVLIIGSALWFCSIAMGMESDVSQRTPLPRTSRASDRSAQLKRAGGDWKVLTAAASYDSSLGSPVFTRVKEPGSQISTIYRARRAIEQGDAQALKEILDSGEIDFTPQKGEYTSASFALLYCAASLRYPKLCKMLLRAGANPNASSIEHPEGNTILSETICLAMFPRAKRGIPELCTLLIQHGAVITERCKQMADLAGGGFF